MGFFGTEAINYVKLNQMIILIKNVTINLADWMTLKLNSKTVFVPFCVLSFQLKLPFCGKHQLTFIHDFNVNLMRVSGGREGGRASKTFNLP